MAKNKTQFVCQNCGTVHSRWAGKCDGCGAWNTIIEDDPTSGIGGGPKRSPKKGRAVALTTLDGEIEEAPRIECGISELDRVTGGGFVRGSAVLVGGDPGIGKSTLLMQAAAALAATRPSGHLCLRRRGGGAGPAAGPAAECCRCRRADRGRDQCRGHSRHRSPRASGPIWSSSIRSRRCGATWPRPRPARSPRCASACRR